MRKHLSFGLLLLVVSALGLGTAILVVILGDAQPRVPVDRPVSTLRGLDEIKVLAFGTSLTDRKGWVEDLQSQLSTCRRPKFRISRLSLPGANIRWALDQIDSVRALDPDIILIEFATNDADIVDGLRLADAGRITVDVVSALRKDDTHRQIVLMTMNPVVGWLNRAHRPWLAEHFQQYRDIAKEMNTGLLDFAPRWGAAENFIAMSQELIPDGLHPTAEASSQIMTSVIVEYLHTATGSGPC